MVTKYRTQQTETMKRTVFNVKCKNGTATIHTDTGWIENYNVLHNAVKLCFNQWLKEDAPREMYEMYTGSFEELGGESYADWKGAIEDGIDAISEYCRDNQTDITSGDFLGKIDLTAVFEV